MPKLEFAYDVFLSHSTKDKAVVRDVAERLRNDGVKVWFDEWLLKPGDSIPAKIEEGLEHSRVLVLFMSAHTFGSDWAQLESGTFRFRDPLNKERRFLPLRLDDAPIKGSLAQFKFIDWNEQKREHEYAKLLEACGVRASSISARNPKITYDEQTQIIDIFRHAPPVEISVTSISTQAGEQFRPAMECARCLYQAFVNAGVKTRIQLFAQDSNVPSGANIFWIKSAINDELVQRIIKAVGIKSLHPRIAPRPATKGCDIDLMIGNDPYRE